ncbi:hypothetical protein N7474_004183 [Penicillium riverlandense]|uniref:uncharacterized protein n=1 Tax=Penicillium riverlandense TaxID=1903569 RepID=UPI0025484740|nr:uncharacterized protein N7474_004183 [Penicillium riverlandense]KAJ5818592.1 hypothetical protein N7474_004183 [Penicillium riverlandense]
MSLKDQIARLQDKVDDLYKNRNLGKGDLPDIQETQNSPETDTQSASLPATSSPLEDTYLMNDFEKFMDNSTVFSHEQHTPTLSSKIFENTDTFVAQTSSPSSLAISSQIGALQKLVTNQQSVKFNQPTQQDHVLVHLPETSTLWFRVDSFFQEFSCYFPFLREEQVRERLSIALNSIGYDDANNNVPVDAANCKIISILFNMMAYAEAVTESHSLMESRPGSQSYCEGLKLMQSMGNLHDNDIETLIYHTLAAATFMAMEILHMALQSVSQGFHIALRIELNNQRRWPENKDDDLACRQSLWWTLYFLDKRVTQKIGITYSVRENECGVREFQNSEKDLGSQAHHDLLQSMISFGQLWASIWDDFFSPKASIKEDAWEDMEVTDTKIILAYRRLPSRLHWKSQEVDDYLSKNESEKQIRRRLLVFLVRLVTNDFLDIFLINGAATEIFMPSAQHTTQISGVY